MPVKNPLFGKVILRYEGEIDFLIQTKAERVTARPAVQEML